MPAHDDGAAHIGAGVTSPDRITRFRDSDGDGTAETKSVLPPGLHSPFGMALTGSDLYAADTDAGHALWPYGGCNADQVIWYKNG
jgi:glucose/arabinose dehydrogenase